MNTHLETYLNDHLAGSTGGVEISQRLIDATAGMPMNAELSALKVDIEDDRRALRALMKDLDINESPIRKASAWLAEKAVALKLKFDDPAGSEFLIFEALEALSLGIEGKRGLWLALAEAGDDGARFDELIKRAENQRRLVERLRLNAAGHVLAAKR